MFIGDFYYELPSSLPQLNATTFCFVAFCFLAFCLSRPFKSILRPLILLIFNFIFIYSFGINNLVWLVVLTSFSYLMGITLKYMRKWYVLFIYVVIYAGLLFFFKYKNTFVGNIAMPLGLSFYSFKVISYLVDVYKGKIKAELNPIFYFDYVMFFPCITAGPINRADDFIKELKSRHEFDYSDISAGFFMLACGLFEKMVVCDFIKTVVSRSLGNAELTGMNVLLGIVLYSFEIYLDFDAYSNMAIGVSRMLGFRFPKNFNVPYLASNIKEFWDRWHISLSTWLRDYVYFPLGGSRKGNIRKYLYILAVFLVSSLWHGLTVNFLIWGMGHAFLRIVEELLLGLSKKKKTNVVLKMIGIVINFALVTFLWIFFRYSDFSEACNVIARVFEGGAFNHELLGMTINEVKWLVLLVAGVLSMDLLRYFFDVYEVMGKCFFPVRFVLYAVMIFVFLIFGVYGGGSFAAGDFIYRWF